MDDKVPPPTWASRMFLREVYAQQALHAAAGSSVQTLATLESIDEVAATKSEDVRLGGVTAYVYGTQPVCLAAMGDAVDAIQAQCTERMIALNIAMTGASPELALALMSKSTIPADETAIRCCLCTTNYVDVYVSCKCTVMMSCSACIARTWAHSVLGVWRSSMPCAFCRCEYALSDVTVLGQQPTHEMD